MCGTKKYSTLPENADKILFAEDFVNHILLKLDLPLLSLGIADHRAVIYNAFNPEVRLAANYSYNCWEEETDEEFEDILKKNTIDTAAFFKYVMNLKSRLCVLPTESGARDLMCFCAKISTMSVKFYQQGVLNAPVLAFYSIRDIINNIDMEEGGWNALNFVASDWAQLYTDMDDNYLTPESASDHDWESESLSNSSSENSEASFSPDHEMDDAEDQGEHRDELTDDKMCFAASSFSSKEPLSSSSDSKGVDKTCDVKGDNIVKSSDNTSDSVSPGFTEKENTEASFRGYVERR